MRSPAVFAVLSACLVLSGCTSSGVDALDVGRPSMEITSSVSRPNAPTPPVAVGTREDPVEELALVAAPRAMVMMPTPDLKPESASPRASPAVLRAPETRRRINPQRFSDAKPINFGKAKPQSLAVHGVDVSRWQGNIDWAKLRSQGANFVYIKATDGGDHLDPMFKKNWKGAADAGLKRGAYHFFYWCRVASEQADWFIRNVPKVPGALPPVIDVEWNGESRNCRKRPSRERVLEKMQVFMDRLEQHYGQRPIIYTAPDFYADNLQGAFKNYPFWLRAVAEHPSKVYPGRDWVFWQYSGSGLAQGLNEKIDLNVFHGSEDAWHKWVSRHAS
ncbi:glycosyl hydrolase [Mesorhizobium sp. NBSH29]|uniref:glycoside hydrolase family 25 protein n=1 Tax=Mesorhizobium sp. NBSH29 TaxID=2654249 RepID=UPI00189682DE|nr:GH25 family lysozyme [Mesorhizobium sp. NBSH29]QPC88496.1 glycosyl hydrolase [Mesorhizobium sp. NBSH29]